MPYSGGPDRRIPMPPSRTSHFRLILALCLGLATPVTAGDAQAGVAAGVSGTGSGGAVSSATPGQTVAPPSPGTAGTPAAPRNADPVVASVEGHLIYLSDLAEASKTLPDNLRSLPFETLYPVLLDRMVDHQALVIMAHQRGLDDQ